MAARTHRPIAAVLAVTLLLSLPLLAIAAIEIGGRAVVWARHGVPGHSYGIYADHPVLKGILAPLTYNTGGKVINGQRFQRRDETPERKPADRLRVIVYGGSTTFAYNLPTGLDWPLQLEAQSQTKPVKLEVLNAGDINWTLHHALVRSREDLPRFRPDVVVFYEGINEEPNYELLLAENVDVPARVRAGEYGLFNVSIPQCRWLYRNSILVKLVAQHLMPMIDRLSPPPLVPEKLRGEPRPEVAALFKGDLANALREWQRAGAHVVYVIQANGLLDSVRNRQLVSYSRDGAEVARRLGATVVDAQQPVSKAGGDPMDLFGESGVHWNARGSRLLAEFLYEQVEASGGWRPAR